MKKRYIVYALLIFLVLQSVIAYIAPVRPWIQLPGEIVFGRGTAVIGGITNTFLATLLTFVLIIILAVVVRPKSRSADEVPTGFYNFFEMLIEMSYGYVENAAGKWAKTFFPFFMTFILWIVIANWIALVPGFDSVGKWETFGELRKHQAEAAYHAEHGDDLTKEQEEDLHHIEEVAEEEANELNEGDMRSGIFLLSKRNADEGAALGPEKHHTYTGLNPEAQDWTIVPFLRPAASDLNFTLALALISVVMTQYYGMKAQGMKYWSKFFIWDAEEIKKNPLAVINTGVGLLEFVSEMFKVVSFAFRLLGNVFAGMVLLFVIGSLLPVANLVFYHLEFGVGMLQGVVFALLTLTFMKSATEEVHH